MCLESVGGMEVFFVFVGCRIFLRFEIGIGFRFGLYWGLFFFCWLLFGILWVSLGLWVVVWVLLMVVWVGLIVWLGWVLRICLSRGRSILILMLLCMRFCSIMFSIWLYLLWIRVKLLCLWRMLFGNWCSWVLRRRFGFRRCFCRWMISYCGCWILSFRRSWKIFCCLLCSVVRWCWISCVIFLCCCLCVRIWSRVSLMFIFFIVMRWR